MLGRFGVILLMLSGSALACSAPPAPQATAPANVGAPARTVARTQPAAAEPAHLHEPGEAHQHDAPQNAAAEPGLVRIADPGNICMLSNRYLGDKQHVPVEVEGKTYFGCCAGCAGKLAKTPEARLAVDPVSGRTMDKATAVLARDERGKVLYFESEETFARARDAR